MTRRARRSNARRANRSLVAVVAMIGMLAAACTSDGPVDADDRLASAFRETLDAPFAFHLAARADEEALEGLGDVLGPITARLNLFEVAGTVDGDTTTVDVSVFGTAPVLQIRRYGDSEQYLRVGLAEGPLATLVGPTVRERVDQLADLLELPATVVDALDQLFEGQWIGVSGVFDAARLQQLLGGGTSDQDGAQASPDQDVTPFPDFVDTYLEVSEAGTDDGTSTFEVQLRFRELVRSMSQLGEDLSSTDLDLLDDALVRVPERVEGTVVSRDGRVEQIVFDVAAAARAAGEDVPGSIRLELELTDHGEPQVPEPPEAAVVVPSDDLLEALARLLLMPPA